jgi:putative ABC transport system permease protein
VTVPRSPVRNRAMAGELVTTPAPRTRWWDVVATAARAVLRRRARSLMTSMAVALGAAALVTTVVLAGSASAAVSDQFDSLRARSVTMAYDADLPSPDAAAVARARRLNGVTLVGRVQPATDSDIPVSRVPARFADRRTGADSEASASVVHADPDGLRALGVALLAGRWPDAGQESRRESVGVIEESLASRLGLPVGPAAWTGRETLWVDGMPVSLLGVFRTSDAVTTGTVVLPWWRFADPDGDGRVAGGGTVVLRTDQAASDQVAKEAPRVLAPRGPDKVVPLVQGDPRTLGRRVSADLQALYIGLALISLLVGALTVTNTMMLTVNERRHEIGVRRAVGARRGAIAGQFLVESLLLGTAGSLIGLIVGLDVAVLVCLKNDWILTVDWSLIALSPLLGALAGACGGGWPAWQSSRVAPAESLRS